MARKWISLLRSLGEALVEVLSAEVAALREDVASTGRHLAIAVVLAGVAATMVFWALGAAAFLVYQILRLWLSGWLSALIVLSLLLLLASIVGALARRRFQRVESPAATVRRRITDHQKWWEESLLEASSDPEAAAIAGDQIPDGLESMEES